MICRHILKDSNKILVVLLFCDIYISFGSDFLSFSVFNVLSVVSFMARISLCAHFAITAT